MSESLKIFQVASHDCLERGGAVQMLRLSRGLAERGHDVRCLFHCADPPAARTLRASERFADAGLALELYNMGRLGELGRFRGYFRAERPDVVHVHRETALRFVFLSTLGLRIPCFVANRGTEYKPLRKTLERPILKSRKLHRVLAVADAVGQALVQSIGIAPGKVATVYGGVEIEDFTPDISGQGVREEFGFPPAAPLIVQVGAVVEKKGVECLLDAFARLREDLPEARLLFVGAGKTRAVEAFAASHGLSAHVRAAGHRDDVRPYYAAADVVVCASTKGEGLTGALREALAMERPVVSTAVAGNVEIVRDEETGRLVPPNDPMRLADAIGFMLSHAERARQMASAGRRWVLENCDERKRAQQVEAIYREILARLPAKG